MQLHKCVNLKKWHLYTELVPTMWPTIDSELKAIRLHRSITRPLQRVLSCDIKSCGIM